MKMTKKKAKRHMAPYMKYVPKMSNSELKNFLMVNDTMNEHVQLNLQKNNHVTHFAKFLKYFW